MHPFTLAGREFIKNEKPKLIMPVTYRWHTDFGGAMENLGRAMDELFAGSLKDYFYNERRCTYFNPKGSFIRLNHPTAKKLGGGTRVKSITINDNWSKMHKSGSHGQSDAIYGTTYDYNTLEDGREISSGVASYEPFLGKEENAMFSPIPYALNRSLSMTATNYLYEPLGDILYPGPSIVYSKVTTRNIVASNGFSITEFYTAKDFPTRFAKINKQANGNETSVPIQVFNYSNTWESATQGFVVELNDMHGKQKCHTEFDQNKNPILKKEVYYKTKNGKVDNLAKVIDPVTLQVSDKIIGVDYDCIVDANHNYSTIEGGGAQVNFDLGMAGPFPLISLVPIPVVNKIETTFNTLTITKLITRSGIIDSVRTQKFGSITTDKIIAYDKSTGSPIINEMDNEFEQNYRTINLPAHWAYPGMGHASKNQGMRHTKVNVNHGKFDVQNADQYFCEGDEIIFYSPFTSGKFWVTRIESNTITIIDAAGKSEISYGPIDIYVSRSGYKNNLEASVGSLVTMDDPFLASGKLNINSNTKVLSASVNTFSDYWHANNAFARKVTPSQCNCKTNLVAKEKFKQHQNKIADTLNKLIVQMPNNHYSFYINDCEYTFRSSDSMAIQKCNKEEIDTFAISLSNLQPFKNNKAHPCSISDPYLLGKLCNRPIMITSSCLALDCISITEAPQVICVDDGISINPFINGILGNFRAEKSYFIRGTRSQGAIREAGFISEYKPFWSHSNGHLVTSTNMSGWQRGDQVTVVDTRGNTLESLNALDIASGANFQFGNSLMAANAVNASYTDIAYDGFEDITDVTLQNYTIDGKDCTVKKHFTISNISNASIDHTKSHSGNQSLMISGAPVSYHYELFETRNRPNRNNRLTTGVFNLEKADITYTFAPKKDKKYFISAWVHLHNSPLSNYDESAAITINSQTFRASGPIIDGWQQITGEFILNTAFDMQLIPSSGAPIWIDDLRIQPYNSSMKSYAYTSDYYRMAAILDDNNFGTHYEYDAEGKLERVNKETQNGVYTLQDIRTELPKKQQP
jgi:hypothetical protein